MMTRKEIYNKIKKYGLAEQIKEGYGKSYTNLSNEDLLNILDDFESMTGTSFSENVILLNNVNKKVDKLIEVLIKKKVLLQHEVNYILE